MTAHAEKRIFNVIAAWVAALHVVLLIGLFWVGATEPLVTKPKQLIVQTVQLKASPSPQAPTKPAVKPVSKPVVEPATKPAAKSIAKPAAKPVAKPVAKATPKPQPPPPAKAAAAAPSKNIPSKATLDALKSRLAAIPTATAASPTPYYEEASALYENELATKLKILLKLPEVGAVKVALTLNRQGKVLKAEILTAENEANRRVVEMRLPAIQFPPFGSAFAGETTYTFNLTLTNV